MTHFDEIYEIAADGYGIVTTAQAREVGVTNGEMRRWCADGRLVRRGHGVYRLSRWVPTAYDTFAEAVALAGDGAYLWGDAVLSMHDLALVDPAAVTVATPRRVRRRLPDWVRLVSAPPEEKATQYEGIPSQSVAGALRSCKGAVMPQRLQEAVDVARSRGLISEDEHETLKEELK